jgi:hypothetical protein
VNVRGKRKRWAALRRAHRNPPTRGDKPPFNFIGKLEKVTIDIKK